MDNFENELKKDFLNECVDLLEDAENAFMELDGKRNNSDLLNQIFRLAHNLKGTSKAVGFDQLSELTHIAENLIVKLKDNSLTVTDAIVSLLLEFKDKVTEMVEGLKEDMNAVFETTSMQEKFEAITNGDTGATDNDSIVEEDLREANNSMGDFLEVEERTEITNEKDQGDSESFTLINNAALESLRESDIDPSIIKELEEMQAQNDTSIKPASQTVSAAKEVKPVAKQKKVATGSDESIRVKMLRIDQINDVIGELIILQNVIDQRRFNSIDDELTNKSIGMMGKLFKEVQELGMSLRMLPLKNTFQKMNRIVRDISKSLDKDVKLHLRGEDTDVDKTVLEKLGDPIVHIIRNAVDHGLESTEDRVAAGKSAQGNVELMAYHEGSNLVIQVTDDGKGIDPKIIERIAIEKGVIDEHHSLSDHNIIQLIFHPGFSTKKEVTEVSGRGVGMDVVRTNVEGLGGEVKVLSNQGEGSSFKIILPLTLAIIEGMIISVASEKYVLPMSQVYELTQIKVGSIDKVSGAPDMLKLRGEVLPLFYIHDKLGAKVQTKENQIIIVIRGLKYSFGVVVDDVINRQQIVIKKLGEDIRGAKGIIGSAIMGDGKPAFILDLFELFKNDFKESRGYKKLRADNAAA